MTIKRLLMHRVQRARSLHRSGAQSIFCLRGATVFGARGRRSRARKSAHETAKRSVIKNTLGARSGAREREIRRSTAFSISVNRVCSICNHFSSSLARLAIVSRARCSNGEIIRAAPAGKGAETARKTNQPKANYLVEF